jgi:hypothetical protein
MTPIEFINETKESLLNIEEAIKSYMDGLLSTTEFKAMIAQEALRIFNLSAKD